MLTDRNALGKIIWETSRADEQTISATGANIVADAILLSDWLIEHDRQVREEERARAGVVAEEPEAARIITTEAEANALPVGSVIRDNMGDARQKVSDRGWEQSGVVGWWGPTWVAFPAEVLWVPVKQGGTTHAS